MARLLLGVSGGIAAYKALEIARLAIKAGHAVRVIQTPTSERFVGRASFAAHHRRAGADRRVRARPGARRLSRRAAARARADQPPRARRARRRCT